MCQQERQDDTLKASFLFYKTKEYRQALFNLNQATKLIAFNNYNKDRNNMYRNLRAKTFLKLNNVKAACYDINLVKDRDLNWNFSLYGKDKEIVDDNC